MAQVAFLGLGVMGAPMAGHLTKAGHSVTVYNRTAARAERWAAEFGGESADTPAAAAADAEFVFCCVGNDDDLRAVTTAPDGAFQAVQPGAVFVDHTTTSAAVARELHAEAAERGFSFIDAPVSGGQAGAENGQLTVMIGGDEGATDRARPLIDCYARMQARLGGSGSGQLAKMVNQICIAGLVQGLAEALNFADRAGLDARAVAERAPGHLQVVQHPPRPQAQGGAVRRGRRRRHPAQIPGHVQPEGQRPRHAPALGQLAADPPLQLGVEGETQLHVAAALVAEIQTQLARPHLMPRKHPVAGQCGDRIRQTGHGATKHPAPGVAVGVQRQQQ